MDKNIIHLVLILILIAIAVYLYYSHNNMDYHQKRKKYNNYSENFVPKSQSPRPNKSIPKKVRFNDRVTLKKYPRPTYRELTAPSDDYDQFGPFSPSGIRYYEYAKENNPRPPSDDYNDRDKVLILNEDTNKEINWDDVFKVENNLSQMQLRLLNPQTMENLQMDSNIIIPSDLNI